MIGEASTLDIGKLRKLRELMERGATEGERQAAKAKAEKLASDAGLALSVALSRLDTPQTGPTLRDMFAVFDDWMEGKEPGYKARKAAERTEKERRRLARCAELLREYGSEDAVFSPTPIEEALRVAMSALLHAIENETERLNYLVEKIDYNTMPPQRAA
jgi:hypothetical protein